MTSKNKRYFANQNDWDDDRNFDEELEQKFNALVMEDLQSYNRI